MIEIISVRFKNGGKQYYFNPNGMEFQPGDGVIVETSRGAEYALCTQGNTPIDEMELTAPLRPVVRAATPEDLKAMEGNAEREKKAFAICQRKIADHGLDMKLISAEYSFDGTKALFFFTSEGRVDFRALVKDLASTIHARIELRQIGVRDAAKMLGGLGICGKPFCCSQFLDEFQPVSIKMAKTQNLSLNPTKISGTCGRLMCCLKYEQNAYEDAAKRMPKAESFVQTPDGPGNVKSVDLLRETMKVSLDSAGPNEPLRTYRSCEIKVLRNGKGSRDGIEIPKDRPARLQRQDAGEEPFSRFNRRPGPGKNPIPVASVLAGEPAAEEDRRSSGRRRHRPKGGKPRPQGPGEKPCKTEPPSQPPRQDRPPRQEKAERAAKQERVEKLPVRPNTDTTAEKKAAADRAARQQSGGQNKEQANSNISLDPHDT